MTRHWRSLTLVAIAAVATACEPLVRVERDGTVSIPAGARWAWSAPDADGAPGEVVPTEDLHRIVAEAVTQGLEARGFALTTADSAQFFVHFHVARRVVVDTLTPSARAREANDREPQDWGRYGDPEQMRDRTMSWQEGVLVVDALSADGRHVAWRGIIRGEVTRQAERDPAPAIHAAVERLLALFP